jgi:predicted alpha/beta-hydrolase family hydrolase
LAARGYVAVKFNFLYKERGGRAPDPAPYLEACYASVVEAIRCDTQIAAARLVIGGKSLGGRMASHLAARGEAVAGLIFLGYPLHPAGQVDRPRSAHLDKILAPMLFFAGTRDSLCNLDLLKRTLQQLPSATTLHIIEGGDHSFNVLKSLHRDPADVWQEIISTSADWLATLAV